MESSVTDPSAKKKKKGLAKMFAKRISNTAHSIGNVFRKVSQTINIIVNFCFFSLLFALCF
jgi:hypothetical protein